MRTHNFIPYQAVNGTIVILAFGAFFVNLILQTCLLVLRVAKKDIPVGAWLRVFNVAMFAVQIIFFFYLPGN